MQYTDNYSLKLFNDTVGGTDDQVNATDFNDNTSTIDTQLKANADKISANTDLLASNLITNGNFTSTDGWTTAGGTLNASANVLTATASGGFAFQRFQKNVSLTNGHKFYARIKYRVTNSNCVRIYFGQTLSGTTTELGSLSNPTINTWYNRSVAFTGNGATEFRLYHAYADTATANGKVMESQYVAILDLTTIFGAGNEPTVKQMDVMMSRFANSWFDATPTQLSTIETLQLDKANKTQEDWITPTLLNGWTSYAGHAVQYYKDEFNVVHIRGRAIPTGATNSILFTLPTGYKPSRTIRGSGSSGDGLFAIIYALADSFNVVYSTTKDYYSFDIFEYKAEA